MIAKEITFINPVPVLGTYVRESYFSAAAGWIIDVHDYGVTLSKPEGQNVPEVPAFCICGVGYSVPEDATERQIKEMLAAGLIDQADAVAMRAGYGSHGEMVKALAVDAATPADKAITPEVVRGLSYAELAVRPAKGRKP